jgi:hypothetical protein
MGSCSSSASISDRPAWQVHSQATRPAVPRLEDISPQSFGERCADLPRPRTRRARSLAAQFSAGYTTNISGFDLRQAQWPASASRRHSPPRSWGFQMTKPSPEVLLALMICIVIWGAVWAVWAGTVSRGTLKRHSYSLSLPSAASALSCGRNHNARAPPFEATDGHSRRGLRPQSRRRARRKRDPSLEQVLWCGLGPLPSDAALTRVTLLCDAFTGRSFQEFLI